MLILHCIQEVLLLSTIFIINIYGRSLSLENQVDEHRETAFTTKIDTASNSIKENKNVVKSTNANRLETAQIRSYDTSSQVCESRACHKVAGKIKASLNLTADECEDFYSFACGGWQKANDIPSSENEITSFTVLTKEIENAIHELIKQPRRPGESEALVKARKFFQSCMDTETIDRLGPKPAVSFIEWIGGWSICNNDHWAANKERWDQYEILKKIQRNFYPAPAFFTVEVTNDHLNSTKHLIKVF